MFFILLSCFGNGGFNLLSRGDSPKRTQNNSNGFQCGCCCLIMVIQVCVLPAFFYVVHCQYTIDTFNFE